MHYNEFSLEQVGVCAMILFAVIDILGNIPILISIKQKNGRIQPIKASLVALGIMVAFLFLGENILRAVNIKVEEFAVAGSFILFFLAIEMVLGITLFKDDNNEEEMTAVVSVVPVAFPILAGAGTMTSLISLKAEFASINILAAIFVNIILVFLVLQFLENIEKLLGKPRIMILKKVFGIILLAISVKLFSANIQELFH